jgi:hypothetical protein
VYQAAAQLAVSLPDDLRRRTDYITVGGPDTLGFVLRSGTTINLGAPVDVRNKLTAVATLLIRQDPQFITAIDVSTGQPIVQNG